MHMSANQNQYIQQRLILNQLGVIGWVPKTTHTRMLDMLSVVSTTDLPCMDKVHTDPQKPTTQSKLGTSAKVSAVPKNLTKNLDTTPSILDTSSSKPDTVDEQADVIHVKQEDVDVDGSAIQIHLQAFVYRHFLLIVDSDQLDMAGQSTWQSLIAALRQNTPEQGIERFDYPMFPDDPQAGLLQVIASSFKGFIFGRKLRYPQIDQLILLTDLPDALSVKMIHQITKIHTNHRIDVMTHDKSHKKQLWQLLHSSADA